MKILKEAYSVFNDSEWLQDKIKKEDLPTIVNNFYNGTGGFGLQENGISKTSITKNHVDTGDVDSIVGTVTNVGCDEDGRLWAELDIQDELTIEKFKKNLIPDVSVGLRRDSLEEGYKLDHIALVRVPAVKGMQHFIMCSDEGHEVIYVNCQGDDIMEDEKQVEKTEVPVEDDLWARFEMYCQENEIDPIVEISNLIESYMTPEPIEESEESEESESKDSKKNLIEKIRGLFRKPIEAKSNESEVIENVNIEAKEEINVINVVEESKEVLELKEKLKEEEDKNKQIIEAKRLDDWDRIWNANVGIKVKPREKEFYKELIYSPDKLNEMLELRETLTTFDRRERIELTNPSEEGLEYDPIIHEMGLVKHVKERGLDKPDKKELYNRLVSDLKAQKQKQEQEQENS